LRSPEARSTEEILVMDSRGQVAIDLPLQDIGTQRRVDLRVETPGD